jgi:hypothetical protein
MGQAYCYLKLLFGQIPSYLTATLAFCYHGVELNRHTRPEETDFHGVLPRLISDPRQKHFRYTFPTPSYFR